MNVPAAIRITRPVNALVAGFASVIGFLIATGTLEARALALIPVVTLITAGGNVINDYCDIEIDRVNRPDRPLPSGQITPHHALLFAALLFGSGLLLTIGTSPLCALIALFNSAILLLYAGLLKRMFLIGNIAVSYLSASIFLFGGALASVSGFVVTVPVAIITFCAMLAREIIKDAEDIEGDAGAGADTLPIRYGIQAAVSSALLCILIASAASIIPVTRWGWYYLLSITAIDAFLLVSGLFAFRCACSECVRASRATTFLKAGMFASLIVFSLSAVFL